MIFLWLALYLIGLAGWAKGMRARRVPLKRRRIYALIVAAVPLGWATYSICSVEEPISPLFTFIWLLIGVAISVLSYAVLAHAPKWIVGKYGEPYDQGPEAN
jgi:hypothetical protein